MKRSTVVQLITTLLIVLTTYVSSYAQDAPPFSDRRINGADIDAPVVAYCRGTTVQIYVLSEAGIGQRVLSVTKREVDEVGIPMVNTLVDESETIQVYRLTTGEFQLVADAPTGMRYNLIYDGCTFVDSFYTSG